MLNSKLINWYAYFFIFGKAIRTMQFDNPITSRLPIPKKPELFQKIFINVADDIFELKSTGKDSSGLEQQIDNMVYKLYELTYEEVKVIDPDFGMSVEEYETVKV